ncbi:MAG: TROVE domain-containing protein [Anaerolineae bacterium]|nr:TROVE domain-containing protein [Anaerolineae bacterium]
MAKNYLQKIFSTQSTPQNEPIPGTNQVKNSAGGYVWQIDPWDHLRRFLILGSEGGSYYAKERELTLENATNVARCIESNGLRVVSEVVGISQAGRAPKNDPAIFVLAMCAAFGDNATRQVALAALPQVCRIGTHLFTFAELVQGMRGWGRGLRRAIGQWYTATDAGKLAYQVIKYRQRNGWTHTDTLRLAHPKPQNDDQKAIFNWITKRDQAEWAHADSKPESAALATIWAFERVQRETDIDQVLKLITDYDLPREALPTEWLNQVRVWDALLPHMPMTAMIRNLATMSRVGLLRPGSEAEQLVIERLRDRERLAQARIHPIAVLSAMRVYKLGYSLRGQATSHAEREKQPGWKPSARVLDALDDAFELAFKTVQPANKRMLLALDVSGSMGAGMIAGVPGLTPRDGSAAMALVTMRTEPNYHIVAFQQEIMPLKISAKQRLDNVIQDIRGLPFGGTDCAKPMLYALENRIPVDTFVIYTDSETWYGNIHPFQALKQYRQQMDIPARLVVVGMIANQFTIANPNDKGMLDVVGFDTAAPDLISAFARDEV